MAKTESQRQLQIGKILKPVLRLETDEKEMQTDSIEFLEVSEILKDKMRYTNKMLMDKMRII